MDNTPKTVKNKMQTYHLYEELRDIAVNDATVYSYLSSKKISGASDIEIAIGMIRALSKEKKQYFDMAVKAENMSIRPFILNKDDI